MAGRAGTSRSSETHRFRALYNFLSDLNRAAALEDLYQAALVTLLDVTEADRAAILLFDEDGVMRFKASHGLSRRYQAAATGHSPWTRGALDAHPVVVPDVQADQSVAAYHDLMRQEGIRAVTFVPLALDAGVIGKFMLYYAAPHESTRDELEVATVIAAHLALATARKRAELDCIRNEQLLQAIVDNSATAIVLKDLQGGFLLVNRRYEELFHIGKKHTKGLTDYDVFPASIADRLREDDHAVLAARKPLTFEESVPHDDGIHSYISIKFPVFAPSGDATGVCSIATDITERNQLEAASRHLAAIVESSDDAIVSKDLNGMITTWNKGAERMFGYTAAEVIGRPVSILTAPERLDEMPQILNKIRKGDRINQFETRRRRKDGQVIDVALTVSPVRNAAGQIVGASKIARDITGRKKTEQERDLLLARERDARRIAELLNRVAPRLATQLDLNKLIQEVTDIATRIIGAELGAFFQNVGGEGGESFMLHTLAGEVPEAIEVFPVPDRPDIFGPAFPAHAVVRCSDVLQDPRYVVNPDQSGTEPQLPVRSYLAAPVISRSGEILGGLFFGHSAPDRFTEIHEAIISGIAAQAAIAMDNANLFERAQWVQAELKRSNEELRRANQDLETFAYSASHDLQEPLRTIAISAEIIERNLGQRLQGQDATFVANILSSSQRMSILIQDLLTYTKATKYEEGPAPNVDSARVLADVLESLRGIVQESGAIVTAAELPVVAIHESRLYQLFQNLISNAIKYRGKGVPRVRISASQRDGWCVFCVVDNGIGVDSQYADQIFGLFKRLHGRDEYPGSGIGLAICQRVAEQYGGRIWLERSEPGGGSTFCFSLPSGSR